MTTLLPESDNAERGRLNPAHVGDVDAILRARSLTFPCKPSIVAAAIGQTFMPVQLSNWFRRSCRLRRHAAIVTTTVRHFLTAVSASGNGRRQPVTPAMALRLGKLCGNGPDLWLNLQKRHDLHHAQQELGETIKKIPTLQVA